MSTSTMVSGHFRDGLQRHLSDLRQLRQLVVLSRYQQMTREQMIYVSLGSLGAGLGSFFKTSMFKNDAQDGWCYELKNIQN